MDDVSLTKSSRNINFEIIGPWEIYHKHLKVSFILKLDFWLSQTLYRQVGYEC